MKAKWKVIRSEVTSRGGGIEVDLSNRGWKGVKMTAYQNYLGGGILGRIKNDCTIRNWEDNEELCKIAEELRMHYHSMTNLDELPMSYEQNQMLPDSAY